MRPVLLASPRQAWRGKGGADDLTNRDLRVFYCVDQFDRQNYFLPIQTTNKRKEFEVKNIVLAAAFAIAGVSIPATANAAVCQHFYNDPVCHWSSPPTPEDIRDHELAMRAQGQLIQPYYPGYGYGNGYDPNRTVVVTRYHKPRRGDMCFLPRGQVMALDEHYHWYVVPGVTSFGEPGSITVTTCAAFISQK